MRVLTLNVRGLRNRKKRLELFKWIRKNKYDLVALQETYILQTDINNWTRQWNGKLYATPCTTHSMGNVILMSKHFDVSEVEYTVINSRLQVLSFSAKDETFNVINCYGPCDDADKNDYLEQFKDVCSQCSSDVCKIIALGDFNMMLDNEVDNVAGLPHDGEIVRQFNSAVEACELSDVWRSHHPGVKSFTWKRRNPFVARRLDYVFTSHGLLPNVSECKIVVYPKSDHDGVEFVLNIDEAPERGPGYYKINNSVLYDKDYVDGMNDLIDQTVFEYKQHVDPQILWDVCKSRIRSETQAYCKAKNKKRRSEMDMICKELSSLKSKLANDSTVLPEYEALEKKYALHLEYVTKGAFLRSKSYWLEHGEKNSKFFLSLEKYKGRQKVISRLTLPNGETTKDQTKSSEAIFDNFKTIYSKDQAYDVNSLDNYLDGVPVPTLSLDDRDVCELLTLDECGSALKTMKNDSSPGLDGISVAFYKVFWSKIKTLVNESLNCSFTSAGMLSNSQRKAVITLLHKGKDLDKDKITNYRPISLTNIDYKVGAKALASRIQKVPSTIISESQSAYVKGRSMTDNVRLIDDVLWYARTQKLNGVLLALDFSKAFDTLNKDFVIYSLRKFGFGDDLIHWVSV